MTSNARNLVICCDGTGNVWKPAATKTNVVKLVESLERGSTRQLVYYDPGVGTPDGQLADDGGLSYRDLTRRLAGLVWGDGVWTNVAEAYRFLMANYRPGDRIFLFGFSRGAFTARAVSGLMALVGLLRPSADNLIPTALKLYRADAGRARDAAGAHLREHFALQPPAEVHFVGVWDTVESVGVSQLALGAHITSDRTVKPMIHHVRHAVALDEKRWPYAPRLYEVADGSAAGGDGCGERSCKQVWFCGAHSDVGGGYANCGLSNVALHWMVREANALGLVVDFDVLDRYAVNVRDKLHDETVRTPLWTLAGAFRRTLPAGLAVHDSVLDRMRDDALYRPPLPDPRVTEHTLPAVCLPDVPAPVPRPVPVLTTEKPPQRQRVGTLHRAWLLLSAAATAGALIAHQPAAFDLAKAQLVDGLSLDLARTLRSWTSGGGGVAGLLLWDLVLIASYTLLVAIVSLLVLRWEGRGYPSPALGKWACYSGGLLPVADLLENWLTWKVAGYARDDCALFACRLLTDAASLGTGLAAAAKFALLAAFVGTMLVAVARALSGATSTATAADRAGAT